MQIKRKLRIIRNKIILFLARIGIISISLNTLLKLTYGEIIMELFENEDSAYQEFHKIVAKHHHSGRDKGYKYQIKYTK